MHTSLLGLLAKIKGIFRERLWSGWRVGVTRWLSQTGELLTHGGQMVVSRVVGWGRGREGPNLIHVRYGFFNPGLVY